MIIIYNTHTRIYIYRVCCRHIFYPLSNLMWCENVPKTSFSDSSNTIRLLRMTLDLVGDLNITLFHFDFTVNSLILSYDFLYVNGFFVHCYLLVSLFFRYFVYLLFFVLNHLDLSWYVYECNLHLSDT